MNSKIKRNILIFCLLVLGMEIFPYIPIYILRIDLSRYPDGFKILYQILCDVGFMGIIYYIYRKDLNNDIKKYFKNFDRNLYISFKYYIVGYIVMIVSNIIIGLFFHEAVAGNEEAVRSLIDRFPLYMFFSVSIYAPFVEEIIFRKIIYDIVYSFKESKYTKYIYIFISGFVFAGLHVFGKVNNPIDYIYIIPYLGLGIAFAALYHKSKNIFTTIMMHSLHNTIAIVRYFKGGM